MTELEIDDFVKAVCNEAGQAWNITFSRCGSPGSQKVRFGCEWEYKVRGLAIELHHWDDSMRHKTAMAGQLPDLLPPTPEQREALVKEVADKIEYLLSDNLAV